MAETTQKTVFASRAGHIDELSTRLMIDGHSTLDAADFEHLGRASQRLGDIVTESAARQVAADLNEHLLAIESQLLLLEKDGSSTESLNAIFRGFHTIKDLAGFLDFKDIHSLAHEVETLLGQARTGKIHAGADVIDIVLESSDVMRHELACIVQRLEGSTSLSTRVSPVLLNRIQTAANGIISSSDSAALISLHAAVVMEKVSEATPDRQQRQERRSTDPSSVRIDTVKLDQLMDAVGEMVIAQTLFHHNPTIEAHNDPTLQRSLTQLARTTGELQRIATAMRMVPIGAQFQKTARLVRDLARRTGKQINFESYGEDAELDKTIAEQLSDPLLHMVRNSIDHGIEFSEERIAQGKIATATIRVAAFHQSGQISISISDDERGLDRNRIFAKAVHNGLIQPNAQLTDNEVFLLIFEPGFSTAEVITDTSGRGVGMDVVRKHVQKLRGRIEIASESGAGTTFLIKLPLTLAIIDGLVVMVGQQRYIAPIYSIREILRPTAKLLHAVNGRGETNKLAAGRPQDLADVEAIRQARAAQDRKPK